MTYNSNMFEAGRGSIYKSPPKSKSNANKQAADSMKSAGIGGIGGKPTTSSAKKIQDQFRRETQKDDDRRGIGSKPKVTPTPQKSYLESLYDRVKSSILFAGGDPNKKKRPDPNPGALYTASPFIIPAATAVTASVLGPAVDYTDPTQVPTGMPRIYTPASRDFGKNIGTMSAPEKPDSAKFDVTDLLGLKEKVARGDAPGLMASPSMAKPSTPDMSDAINRTLASIKDSNPDVPYVIQAGDTLSEIAVQTGTTVEDLVRENKIKKADDIFIGNELKIPSAKSTKTKEDIVSSLIQGYERKKDMSGTQVASSGYIRSDAFSGDAITDTMKSLERQIPERDTDLDPMSAQEASFDRKGIMTKPEFGPELYPSNERSMLTYVRDMFPNNPEAQAALATTIYHEGMRNPEEQIGTKGDYQLSKVITGAKKTPSLMRNDQKIYEVLGYPEKRDSKGNIVYLERLQKELNVEAQEALNKAGFDVGKVDGIVGPITKAKIKQFQSKNKLVPTGKLDNKTYEKLGVENKEVDHTGEPIAIRKVTNAPKYIPADKAEEVFNIRYNDHYRNAKLGNVGDIKFAKYRGRGPVQITGIETYKEIGNKIGVDLVKNPDLILTDPEISRVATKAYLEMKDFENLTPEEAIKVINPGQSGIVNTRKPKYNEFLNKLK